ncbi:NAD(P)-dependent oxidoreductase [Lachnospiraceae bacterium KK002]
MNILVTGANGFVGHWIVNVLKRKYYMIGSGTKRTATYDESLDEYIPWDLGHEPVPEILSEQKIDIIVHCAASKDMNDQSESLIYANCMGTYRIFQLAVTCRCKKIIFISSLPVIGIPMDGIIDDSGEMNPQSVYHATKAAGELILNQAGRYGTEVINLRVPSPIGPDMPVKSIVPIFVNKALDGEEIIIAGKGTRRQNYIDVRDLGYVAGELLEHNGCSGTFNIGARKTISNIELARLCVKLTESKSDIKFADREDPADGQDWSIDDRRLRSIVGEYQRHSIEDSILDIARYLRNQ